MMEQLVTNDHEIMDTINHYLQKHDVPFKMTMYKSSSTGVEVYSIHKMENGKPIQMMSNSLDPMTTFELFVGCNRDQEWHLPIWKAYKEYLKKGQITTDETVNGGDYYQWSF